MKTDPGWTYILLEGYCFFNLYSSKKKTSFYTFPDNDFSKKPVKGKPVKNQFYLPKSKLKPPKGCPGHPRFECLNLDCRFFNYCEGDFHKMPHKMFTWYRERDRRYEQSRKKKVLGYEVFIDRDENGAYVAHVPELPGCHSQGKSAEEALKNVSEAIKLCLEHR